MPGRLVISVATVVGIVAVAAAPAGVSAQEPPRAPGSVDPNAPSAAIAAQVERLATGDAGTRADAATRLGAAYPEGAAAVPALLEALEEEDPGVREAARGAIGRLAARGLADVAVFLESVRRPGAAQKEWLAVERDVGSMGPALSSADLAAALDDADRARSGRAVATSVRSVWCATRGDGPFGGQLADALDCIAAVARRADLAARPHALASLAVLGRAELVRRRAAGEARELPTADDGAAVARLGALLAPDPKDDPSVRKSLDDRVPRLLGWTYGHADPAFVERLNADSGSEGAILALSQIRQADLGGLGGRCEEFLDDLASPDLAQRSWAVAALCVRRGSLGPHLPAIRKLLDSKDTFARLVAAVVVLHAEPRDPKAGLALIEEFRIAAACVRSAPREREMQALFLVLGGLIGRLPNAPPGLAAELWSGSIQVSTQEGELAVVRAAGPHLRGDAKYAGYLQRRFFPDEGEPKQALMDASAQEELHDALAAAGVVGTKMVAQWERTLAEFAAADPVESVVALGPHWKYVCPARQIRRLAGAGRLAASAVPALEALRESPDLRVRYLAHFALRRIRTQ